LLQDTIRATDIAGRWGGEEFVIIMPGCGLAEAIPLSERLRLRLEQTVFADGLSVTASIGIALARSTDTWKDWLARADSGLYAAKAAGRNQVVVEDLEVEFIPREMEPSTYRLKWRKSYEIGVPEIDAEHREIFESVNELLALRPPHRSREEILGKVISLAGAVQAHFAHEEKILQSVSHGDAVHAHIATHRVLTQRAGDLIRKYQKGTIDSSALLSFVSFDYIIQHILIEDRSLAPLLARAQPGSKEGPSFF
jgi:hemerythrin-like metal-binding protein